MSWLQRRFGGLRAIVAGTAWLPVDDRAAINREFNEIIGVERVQSLDRRRLLQVLHASRAFNSFLLETVRQQDPTTTSNTIGQLLDEMAKLPSGSRGHLNPRECDRYKRKIRDPRNRVMHSARALPGPAEVFALLAEVATCITDVLR
jgi:hypothetical protein